MRREWHKRVPSLVAAFNESPEAFKEELASVRGLRGASVGGSKLEGRTSLHSAEFHKFQCFFHNAC